MNAKSRYNYRRLVNFTPKRNENSDINKSISQKELIIPNSLLSKQTEIQALEQWLKQVLDTSQDIKLMSHSADCFKNG